MREYNKTAGDWKLWESVRGLWESQGEMDTPRDYLATSLWSTASLPDCTWLCLCLSDNWGLLWSCRALGASSGKLVAAC